jgi:hypothetical protein
MSWLHHYNAAGPAALSYQRTGGRPPFARTSRPPLGRPSMRPSGKPQPRP